MDLNTVTAVRAARTRADLAALDHRTAVLAGGSWLFGEPQDHLTGLVDITTLGWPAVTVRPDGGLSLAATCTLAEVATLSDRLDGPAAPLFRLACTALHGSTKVWAVATLGGNLCTSLPAGPMTSLAAGLDADVVLWRADGTDAVLPAAAFVTGNTTNALGPGDVLRSVEVGPAALASRTAFRRTALSALGRSGAVLVGRRPADGGFLLTITAATVRPVQLRYPALPDAAALAADVAAVDGWFSDPHGAADWRRAVSGLLAQEIRQELR
ncbi:CO or xanthine dehydrogenase, FAD-binding subunit [Friedmanniella luteola]|uniref:CO or xanthine dehydrogenase, FAD-binding subunit n=1 Tax=Friedmanniella luteola TaxID=546871 RepID=A0A1H2ADW5_9ACTN|nr:FAD binding domain-containing protein [Friedmanniella luteola]SDT43686.1 CO or xanthine dehydrogenase, FAD-binding subunit [Friedmanniella luteola]